MSHQLKVIVVNCTTYIDGNLSKIFIYRSIYFNIARYMHTYSAHICFHISGVIRPLHISVNISGIYRFIYVIFHDLSLGLTVLRQRLTHFNSAQNLKNASIFGVSIFGLPISSRDFSVQKLTIIKVFCEIR